jgi:hypothetical protein
MAQDVRVFFDFLAPFLVVFASKSQVDQARHMVHFYPPFVSVARAARGFRFETALFDAFGAVVGSALLANLYRFERDSKT